MTYAHKKRIFIALVCIAVVIALRFSGISDYITMDFFAAHKQQVSNFVAWHPFLSRCFHKGPVTAP